MIKGPYVGPQISHSGIKISCIIKIKNLSDPQYKIVVIKTFFWNANKFGCFSQVESFTLIEFPPFFYCYYNFSNLTLWLFHSFGVLFVRFRFLLIRTERLRALLWFDRIYGSAWFCLFLFNHTAVALFRLAGSYLTIICLHFILTSLILHHTVMLKAMENTLPVMLPDLWHGIEY